MTINDSPRSRSGVVSVILLMYGLVFGAVNAQAADRTVFGELFSADG